MHEDEDGVARGSLHPSHRGTVRRRKTKPKKGEYDEGASRRGSDFGDLEGPGGRSSMRRAKRRKNGAFLDVSEDDRSSRRYDEDAPLTDAEGKRGKR